MFVQRLAKWWSVKRSFAIILSFPKLLTLLNDIDRELHSSGKPAAEMLMVSVLKRALIVSVPGRVFRYICYCSQHILLNIYVLNSV